MSEDMGAFLRALEHEGIGKYEPVFPHPVAMKSFIPGWFDFLYGDGQEEESREIVPACAHDSISMTVSIEHDRVFWCPACQKKIEIPLYTEASMSQSDMAGIVGLAFGERWKKYLEEMEKKQHD